MHSNPALVGRDNSLRLSKWAQKRHNLSGIYILIRTISYSSVGNMKRTLLGMTLLLCLLFSTLSSAQTAGFADYYIASNKTYPGKTDEIRIGSLIDLTGATADAGEDYAMGIAEAIHYANDKGGVNGTKIKLYQFDYGNRIPEAYAKYKLLKRLGCVVVLGWGADDTEALSPAVNRDKMPYLSATYPAHLTDPAKAPYNLSVSNDFSSSARAAITAWFDHKWHTACHSD